MCFVPFVGIFFFSNDGVRILMWFIHEAHSYRIFWRAQEDHEDSLIYLLILYLLYFLKKKQTCRPCISNIDGLRKAANVHAICPDPANELGCSACWCLVRSINTHPEKWDKCKKGGTPEQHCAGSTSVCVRSFRFPCLKNKETCHGCWVPAIGTQSSVFSCLARKSDQSSCFICTLIHRGANQLVAVDGLSSRATRSWRYGLYYIHCRLFKSHLRFNAESH